jgi:hypothetical protein
MSGNPAIPDGVPYVSSPPERPWNDRQYRVNIQSNIAVGDAIAVPCKLCIPGSENL